MAMWAIAAAAAVGVACAGAVSPPEVKDDVERLPSPYGHTSQIHPYNANRDREWYTEYRWKKGPYPVQDGEITDKPQHAPVPTDYVDEVEQSRKLNRQRNARKLNNKGYRGPPLESLSNATNSSKAAKAGAGVKGASAGAAGTAGGADAAKATMKKAAATDAAAPGSAKAAAGATNATAAKAASAEATTRKRKKQNLKGRKEVIPEIHYSIPKRPGHTSQTSPAIGDKDREWYTEYRWKKGPYPVQDGVITEKPALQTKPKLRTTMKGTNPTWH